MSRETRYIPLFQRLPAPGAPPSRKIAGLSAALKPGDDEASESVTWLVDSHGLRDLVPQAETDYLRDTAGRWWRATAVGELADDKYPITCARWRS
ncbi:hypothetical protein GobsT_71340 [Gemmata obscuriglobus]|uniref:Uncharacterized protein n=1 Tax=Gemmata obscuriglobus TaxID=114 RepID=A0A2Z3H6X3_9BACT|nr:hypothetical protein [Gemmata obscuriglobus]AWM41763.1 hypothetical protein C1280_35385 [Gemmata obscuriglobus]QEG32281.1 hypothetical protein GobsT_71340 [Gemmata obscuriglobus]VTS11637.1 unnamed protein product [Gemmata obscuriglobus UQM 2246]